MPYVQCPECTLSSFTAAAYSSRDECPRCGTELPRWRPVEPARPAAGLKKAA